MAAIVQSWGIDDRLVKIFEEQEIDERVLSTLDLETVRELIPIIGLRKKFLEKWTAVYGSTPESSADSNTATNKEENHSRLTSDEEHELTRQDAFLGETSFQMRTRSLNIKKILEKSIGGKGILKSYQKTKVLSRKCRNQIVDLILSDILVQVNRTYHYCITFSGKSFRVAQSLIYYLKTRMNETFSLKNCDFEFLAKKIVEVFPCETAATYYVPPIPKRLSRGQNKSITSRGKLVDKYRNKIKQYKLLTGYKVTDESPAAVSVDENETATDSDEMKAAVTWLEKHTAPWDDVIEKWEFTKEYRRQNIVSNANAKVCSIYERWPVLKHPMGYRLIQRDYDYLKLSTAENTQETWSAFYANVEKIRSCNKEDSNATALTEILKLEDLNDDAKVVVQLLMLSHLIPPKGRIRKNKKDWKPSITECKDSIIMHAVLPGDIVKIQEDRLAFVKRLGLSDQPFIIVVGPNLTTFSSFYVSIDKILYQVESALTALDICFQAFHVLDAQYPVQSEHLWLLIQKGLYKFATKWDKSISYIEETLGMMSNLEKGNV